MRIELPSLYLTLQAGEPVTIAGATGTSIRVLEGRVWLTEEGVSDDTFIFAGGDYRLRSRGRVVLDCDAPTRIVVEAPVSVRSSSNGLRWLGTALLGLLGSFAKSRRLYILKAATSAVLSGTR